MQSKDSIGIEFDRLRTICTEDKSRDAECEEQNNEFHIARRQCPSL